MQIWLQILYISAHILFDDAFELKDGTRVVNCYVKTLIEAMDIAVRWEEGVEKIAYKYTVVKLHIVQSRYCYSIFGSLRQKNSYYLGREGEISIYNILCVTAKCTEARRLWIHQIRL